MYAGCPITWWSKLQTTLTALSTTEAEYVALSSALRDQIPIMQLMKEAMKQGIDVKFVPGQWRGGGGGGGLSWFGCPRYNLE